MNDGPRKNIHLPFLYMERGKRPGSSHFLKVVLADDFAVLLLALTWLSPDPLLHGPMLLAFHLSFWCIYELGYAENDRLGAKHEKDPHLKANHQTYLARVDFTQGWLWALLLAAPGFWLLDLLEKRPLWPMMLAWPGVLVVLRGTYWLFNRLDKPSRVWPYLLLQWLKCFPFLILAPGNWLAVAFFSAQTVSRWFAYLIYRLPGQGWPDFIHAIRFFLFLSLAIGGGWSDGQLPTIDVNLLGQFIAMTLFFAYRGRRQIAAVFSRARRIDRTRSGP